MSTADDIARDIREGRFPQKGLRSRLRELATPPRDDFDRAVLALLDQNAKLRAALEHVMYSIDIDDARMIARAALT